MKAITIPCLLSCLLLITGRASATTGKEPRTYPSQSSGIYKSLSDYRLGRLLFADDCQHEKNRIRLNDFLGKPYITVIHEGKKYTCMKDSIFGLRTCDGHDFRVYHRQLFEIEEPNTIVVYRQVKMETGSNHRGVKPVAVYFFSNGLEAAIMPLTKRALEAAFPGNDKFRDLLEMYYKDDLSGYDTYRHTYKVNLLLQAAR